MSRFDVLRSLLRAGADRAWDRVGEIDAIANVQRMLAELRRSRLVVHERALTQAVARTPGVRAATVTARRGALLVDVTFADGEVVACRFEPDGVSFAPRGAKEIRLRVEPTEALRRPRTREVASALIGVVAQTLWSVALPREAPEQFLGAIVDRDGADLVRSDLRTVPAIRRAQSKGTTAMLLELLELKSVAVEDGELVLQVKLPSLV